MPRHGGDGDFLNNTMAQEAVLEAVANGVTPVTAMRGAGYTDPKMLYTWAKAAEHGIWQTTKQSVPEETLVTIRDFLERLEIAKARGSTELAAIIKQAALTPNEKTGLVDWRAAQFLLTHSSHRDEWFEQKQPGETILTVRHANLEHREVREMSDQELLVDPEWAKLLGAGTSGDREPSGD